MRERRSASARPPSASSSARVSSRRRSRSESTPAAASATATASSASTPGEILAAARNDGWGLPAMTTQPRLPGTPVSVRYASRRPPADSVPSSAQADVSSRYAGCVPGPPASTPCEVSRILRPLERSTTATWRSASRPSAAAAVARTLASGSSKRTIPSGIPRSSRTSAEFDTTHWPVSAERYGCETCTPPGRVPSVARKNGWLRTSRESALTGAASPRTTRARSRPSSPIAEAAPARPGSACSSEPSARLIPVASLRPARGMPSRSAESAARSRSARRVRVKRPATAAASPSA